MEKETLSAAYRRAGIDFLAVKLMAMFQPLHNPEGVAAHNIIVHDVICMLGTEADRVRCYQIIAGAFMEEAPAKKSRRGICKIIAESILGVSKG